MALRLVLFLFITLPCCRPIEFEKFFPMFGPDHKPMDGHLKPYGWQRPPDGPATEYNHALPAPEFYQNHVEPKKPLVYRGVIRNSSAILNWSDEYLNKTYGHLDVLVELKNENRDFTTGRMKLRTFLKEYKEKQIYIVSLLPSEMMVDIQAVNSVLCGTFKKYTHEANLWMSSGGTRSVIHYDADENFHCLLAGRKDFMLMDNKYHHSLYLPRKEATAGSSYSPVDPDSVDLTKYPNIATVPWLYATLYAGDCVYIPPKHIHQVRSYGRTISATTLFTRNVRKSFTADGCESFDHSKVYGMDAIDFHWTYRHGDPTIDMGYMNVELLRYHMAMFVEDNDGSMNEKEFVTSFNGFTYGESMLGGAEVFKMFKKEVLTQDDIMKLSRAELKLIGRAIDPPHGPVTFNEDVYFLPGEAPDSSDMVDGLDEVTREKVFKRDMIDGGGGGGDGGGHGSQRVEL